MGAFEIATIVVVCVLVAAVIGYMIYKKIKGQSIGCDCGSCNSCPHCSHCKPVQEDKSEKDGEPKVE